MKLNQTVLIVDDDSTVRKILTRVAGDVGFAKIIEARDGVEAFKQYQIYKPYLVLLDIHMPGISGLEVLDTLRKFDPNARIIIMTGMVKKEYILQAAKKGALHYLRKDLPYRDVTARLKGLLQTQELIDERTERERLLDDLSSLEIPNDISSIDPIYAEINRL
jgi:CheY-like chemotaxis protein